MANSRAVFRADKKHENNILTLNIHPSPFEIFHEKPDNPSTDSPIRIGPRSFR
jgi:hypothetical protein